MDARQIHRMPYHGQIAVPRPRLTIWDELQHHPHPAWTEPDYGGISAPVGKPFTLEPGSIWVNTSPGAGATGMRQVVLTIITGVVQGVAFTFESLGVIFESAETLSLTEIDPATTLVKIEGWVSVSGSVEAATTTAANFAVLTQKKLERAAGWRAG